MHFCYIFISEICISVVSYFYTFDLDENFCILM